MRLCWRESCRCCLNSKKSSTCVQEGLPVSAANTGEQRVSEGRWAHLLVRLVRECSDDHLSRLSLTTAVPPHRAGRLSRHTRLFRTRDGERRPARDHQVRERVELDILDAKDAIVRHRKGRGAEQAEEVDGEDPDLVLVLALEQDMLKESQGVLEVMTSACLRQPVSGSLPLSRMRVNDLPDCSKAETQAWPASNAKSSAGCNSVGGKSLPSSARTSVCANGQRKFETRTGRKSVPRGRASKYSCVNSSAFWCSSSAVACGE
jgi:hypothetical protein